MEIRNLTNETIMLRLLKQGNKFEKATTIAPNKKENIDPEDIIEIRILKQAK